MKRRDFFRQSSLAALGTALTDASIPRLTRSSQQAKNIVFMVSDGMSQGALNLTDLYLNRKEGRGSHWINLYRENRIKRALMDTASASSLVTDSAAASSAWGGGVRVPNGSLNVGARGEIYQPILQKFKAAGKKVGCVTTVPITHATPAGFCVTSKSRNGMEDIALQYLDLRFDVMMGGGTELFDKDTRKDKRDLFQEFHDKGFQVAKNRNELANLKNHSPVLGIFHPDALPYTLDRMQDAALSVRIPTLKEMTEKALALLTTSREGFVLQIESGKVDWAAHANDIASLLYEQMAFDEALKVVLDFAEKDQNTLIIITTDHGNSNPGLIAGSKANQHFDLLQTFTHTNDWILNQLSKNDTPAQVIDRFRAFQNWVLTPAEAKSLLESYTHLDETGIYNARQLPFQKLAQMQFAHTSVGWAGKDHSADFVELAMLGPGSEALPAFVKNTDLHFFMLKATGVCAQ